MSKCFICQKEQVRLVRLTESEDSKGHKTQRPTANEIEVCINPKYWRFINISKIENFWVKKEMELSPAPGP